MIWKGSKYSQHKQTNNINSKLFTFSLNVADARCGNTHQIQQPPQTITQIRLP